MFSTIKLAFVAGILVLILGAGWYVSHIKSQLEISEQNNVLLQDSVQEQQEAIKKIQEEVAKIQSINAALNETISEQRKSLDKLKKAFTVDSEGNSRDIGKEAIANPEDMEFRINRGSKNVIRCFEILSGSPLTEDELNAKEKEQTNSACRDLANPNYKP